MGIHQYSPAAAHQCANDRHVSGRGLAEVVAAHLADRRSPFVFPYFALGKQTGVLDGAAELANVGMGCSELDRETIRVFDSFWSMDAAVSVGFFRRRCHLSYQHRRPAADLVVPSISTGIYCFSATGRRLWLFEKQEQWTNTVNHTFFNIVNCNPIILRKDTRHVGLI